MNLMVEIWGEGCLLYINTQIIYIRKTYYFRECQDWLQVFHRILVIGVQTGDLLKSKKVDYLCDQRNIYTTDDKWCIVTEIVPRQLNWLKRGKEHEELALKLAKVVLHWYTLVETFFSDLIAMLSDRPSCRLLQDAWK